MGVFEVRKRHGVRVCSSEWYTSLQKSIKVQFQSISSQYSPIYHTFVLLLPTLLNLYILFHFILYYFTYENMKFTPLFF